MAEEPVNKWWAVGAKDETVARKYLSYLHKHSMFGGHVGLPETIHNKEPNRSLDSSRGVYDMIEVYAKTNTKCPTGTVVNFYTEDPNNPEGHTYVYPCTDDTRPIGYMVTRAEPTVWGVCVVSGILEVPLDYEKGASADSIPIKDYVKYDVENSTFKFSDTGYPVYNVYQDVDGDWIAIILFGNTVAEGGKYDGPFATSIAEITTITETDSTTNETTEISVAYINVAQGDVVFQGTRYTCSGITYNPESTSSNVYLTAGESLWLRVDASGSTPSFSFITHTEEEPENSEVEEGGRGGSSLPGSDVLSGGGNSGGSSLPGSDILSGDDEESGGDESGDETEEESLIDTGLVFYKKIAECTSDLKIRQIQYGNIEYSGVGFPDYYALMGNGDVLEAVVNTPDESSSTLLQSITRGLMAAGESGSGSGSSGIGVGVTYVIPVPGNVPIQVLSDVPSCIDAIIFSPNYNAAGSHKYKYLQVNPSGAWTTPACGGWVRISVLDSGSYGGACLRFYCGEEDWTEALPLFRHGSYGNSGGGGGFEDWLGYPDYHALMGNGRSTNTTTNYIVEFSPASDGHVYVAYAPEGESLGASITSETDSNGNEYVTVNGTKYYIHGDGGSGTTWGTSPISGSGYEDLDIGMGVSFLLPVSGGSAVQVWSDAPECVNWICYAPFLNSENSGTYHRLTLNEEYVVPEGGWVLISLLDNCAYPNSDYPQGACVRFYVNNEDYTGALPLFRHGSSTRTIYYGEPYYGPFLAVKGTTISGATVDEFGSNVPEVFNVEIGDGCGRNASTTNYAGYLIAGSNRVPINGGTVQCSPMQYIYLVGSTDGYSYIATDSTYERGGSEFNNYYFATLIAYVSPSSYGAKVIQVQHGDIVAPPMDLSASVTGGTAFVYLTGSTSFVALKSANNNLSFSSDGAGTLTLTVTGMGGSFGYPAYGVLSTNDQGVTLPDVQGISFLLPVKAGHNIRYYTDASCVVVGRFAPNDGSSGGSEFYISQTNQEAGADGWVRISVFDDGSSPGSCLKFIDNGSEYPLYKFGSGTGGGGGNINAPNWGWNGSSGGEVARIEYADNNTKYAVAPNFYPYTSGTYTTPSSGWLYAFANVRSGAAHLNVNGALFKVAYSESSSYVGSGICIPVNANASVSWNISADSGNYLVGCVFYSTGSGGGGGYGGDYGT